MLWAPWSRMTAQDIRPPTRCLEGPSAMAPLCLRNVKSAAYAGGAMNNSAWQEHRVCAMETGLQRKAEALLMRLRDARRGSLPLNLGHWELSKVFERWSYMTQDRGEAHASTQKGSQPALHLPPLPLTASPAARQRRRHHRLSLVSPFGEGADTGSSAPLSAVHHLGSPSLLVSTYF